MDNGNINGIIIADFIDNTNNSYRSLSVSFNYDIPMDIIMLTHAKDDSIVYTTKTTKFKLQYLKFILSTLL